MECLVSVGYIFDHLFSRSRSRAEGIRSRLVSAGADYVVCLLDSTFADFPNNQTREMMAAFYTSFLQAALAEERLGLVIKPKDAAFRAQLPEIRPLLDRAVGTDRCVVLDRRGPTGTTTHTPLDAAMSANITVGGVHVNTAILEAALADLPALHVDLTGHRTHPFYAMGYGDYLFDDLGAVVDAVRQNREGTREIGTHRGVLAELDPFRDGKAALRVGWYLHSYLMGVRDGLPRDAALAHANAEYTKKWTHAASTPELVASCCDR